MSRNEEVSHKCPYCGKEYKVEIWDTVNAEQDPDLRERCISGDIFLTSCPHCKKEYMIQYPMVYSDRTHKFVIWLCAEDSSRDLSEQAHPLIEQGYTLRRCETVKEFTEKIQILEDGVSDIAVELARYDSFIEFTENHKGKKEDITAIEYQHTENDVMKINVRTNDKGMSFLIPVSVLEEEIAQHSDLYKVDDSKFPVVNSTWITDLFTKASGQA